MTRTVIRIPLRLRSTANLREHWAKKAARVNRERRAVMWARPEIKPWRGCKTSIYVRLVREAPRWLDSDNWVAAAKSVRDQVAAELGRDDSPTSGVFWDYSQEKAKDYAIRIELRDGLEAHADLDGESAVMP